MASAKSGATVRTSSFSVSRADGRKGAVSVVISFTMPLSASFCGVPGQDRVSAADIDLVDAALVQDANRVEDRRTGVDLVVDDDRALLVDVADDRDDLTPAAVVAMRLLHEDERDLQRLGDPASGVGVAEVRHDQRDAVRVLLDDRTERLDEQVTRRELVTGDR